MKLPDDLLLRSPEEAARRIGLSLLSQARSASKRLDDPEDAEALHDFRVAIRRLRSTLRAWGRVLGKPASRKQRKRLSKLQGRTGGGRDAEVLLEWLEPQRDELSPADRVGSDWIVDRLRERKDAAYAEVRGKIRPAFEVIDDDLFEWLDVMRVKIRLSRTSAMTTFAERLAKLARRHADDLADAVEGIGGAKEHEQAHNARILGKRLRYLLEPVGKKLPAAQLIVKRTKQLQDVLGDMNDAAVLAGVLAEGIEAAAAGRARRLHELAVAGDAETLEREQRKSEHSGLLELTQRVKARHDELHRRLEEEWIAVGAQSMREDVYDLADQLEKLALGEAEVERKFLLTELPEHATHVTPIVIEQGWLPGDRLRERLRRIEENGSARYYRTIKFGRGVRRVELEEDTTKEVFERLWGLTEGCRVTKQRYRIQQGEHVWEIDAFTDRELFLAEVELRSEDEEAPPPEWLAPHVVRDVTHESEYVNLNLAK